MTTEEESRKVAEESRETEWAGRDVPARAVPRQLPASTSIHPFPRRRRGAPGVHQVLRRPARRSCATQVDSVAIDETGEYPEHVVDGLRKLGAFGMKIPKEYGGLGFTVSRVLQGHADDRQLRRQHHARCSPRTSRSACRSRSSCSARRSRRRSTCRAAPPARSRPSRSPSRTSAPIRRACRPPPSAHGDFFILNGEKLWCTNGTLAELLVVMARDPEDQEDQRLRRRDRLAGRQGRVPLPLHGPEGARQRRDQLQGRARAAREPDRRGGQGAEDRAHHAQHRPPDAARRLRRHRQAVPRDRAAAGRTRAQQWGVPIWKHEAVGAPHRRHGGDHVRDGLDLQAGERDGRPRRLRHPPRGRGREGVEHGARAGRSSTSTLQIRGGRGYETETLARRAAARRRSRSSA